MDPRMEAIQKEIAAIPDFPKPGILFRDIFPVLRNPALFKDLINVMTEHIRTANEKVDVIVGLDARGFLFGPMIAQNLGVGFVPIRKKGKLPGGTISASYVLEYGSDQFEIQNDALKEGQKVVIVDDLLATGGTMQAACKLVKAAKAETVECVVIIELQDLKGRSNVQEKVHSFVKY